MMGNSTMLGLGLALASVFGFFYGALPSLPFVFAYYMSLALAVWAPGQDSGKPEQEIAAEVTTENVLAEGTRRAHRLPEKFRDSAFVFSPSGKSNASASPKKASTPKKSETHFVVDKIVDKRTMNNTVLYLVKWKGYGDDQNTWEPLRNLSTVMDLVEKFDAKLDKENAEANTRPSRKSSAAKKSAEKKKPAPKPAPPSSSEDDEDLTDGEESSEDEEVRMPPRMSPKKAPPAKSPPKSPKSPPAKRATRRSTATSASAVKTPMSAAKRSASPIKKTAPKTAPKKRASSPVKKASLVKASPPRTRRSTRGA